MSHLPSTKARGSNPNPNPHASQAAGVFFVLFLIPFFKGSKRGKRSFLVQVFGREDHVLGALCCPKPTGSDLLVSPVWSSFSHGNPKGDHLLVLGPSGATEYFALATYLIYLCLCICLSVS